MAEDWQTQKARAEADAFIAEHPEYTRHGVAQPGQGSTNRVIFARRGEELVVLKVFCEVERKEREAFGLRHWRDTGLVPTVICEDNATLIVMSYVPGAYLHASRPTEGEEVWRAACRNTGRAIGTLTQVPLTAAERESFESRFYRDLPTLADYLGRIRSLGRSINERAPDFRGGFWRDSLDFVEAELPGILAQPAVLYHQDVGNMHVQQGRFTGFFDLEMCRVGCAAMQLGAALGLFEDGDEAGWPAFREGWEAATGGALGVADLRAATAAKHLLYWREISRYLSYDGTPGTGYEWAEPADPQRYREQMEAVSTMLGGTH